MIKRLNKSQLHIIKDDPVRPHIPASQRIGVNREVLTEVGEEHLTFSSILCGCQQQRRKWTYKIMMIPYSSILYCLSYKRAMEEPTNTAPKN